MKVTLINTGGNRTSIASAIYYFFLDHPYYGYLSGEEVLDLMNNLPQVLGNFSEPDAEELSVKITEYGGATVVSKPRLMFPEKIDGGYLIEIHDMDAPTIGTWLQSNAFAFKYYKSVLIRIDHALKQGTLSFFVGDAEHEAAALYWDFVTSPVFQNKLELVMPRHSVEAVDPAFKGMFNLLFKNPIPTIP